MLKLNTINNLIIKYLESAIYKNMLNFLNNSWRNVTHNSYLMHMYMFTVVCHHNPGRVNDNYL